MEIINTFKEKLKEDFITKKANEQYSLKDFREGFDWITEVIEKKLEKETEEVLKDYLKKNEFSVFYNYLLASLFYRLKTSNEDLNNKLLKIASQTQKGTVLIHLAKEILNHLVSLNALNILALEYEKEHDDDNLLETWIQILKIDNTNTTLPKRIAVLKEKKNETSEATYYYKIAFIKAYESKEIEEALKIWKQLSKINPKDPAFYITQGKKITSKLNSEEKRNLYKHIISYYEKNLEGNEKEFLSILKSIVNNKIFQENLNYLLAKTYSRLYQSHSHLEDVLEMSGLTKKKNITKGIEIFEGYIKYHVGAFVFHKSFGLGMIESIQKPTGTKIFDLIQQTKLIIKFEKKKNHPMSLRIAINSLQVLPKEHLQALHYFQKEKVNDILENQEKLAPSVLKTLGKPASIKDIKSLLVPKFIENTKWPDVWKKLKEIFHHSSEFEFKNKHYDFFQESFNIESATIKLFENSFSLEKKYHQIEFYLMHSSEYNENILNQFTNYLKEYIQDKKEDSLKALFLLEHLIKSYHLKITFDFDHFFKTLFDIPLIEKTFSNLETSALKNLFLNSVFNLKKENYKETISLLLEKTNIDKKQLIIDHVIHKGQYEILKTIFENTTNHYTKYPETFILLSKIFIVDYPQHFHLNKSNVFLKLLKTSYDLNKDFTLSNKILHGKKLFLLIKNFLFENEILFDYLKNEENSGIKNDIFKELESLYFLDNYLKVKIREVREKV